MRITKKKWNKVFYDLYFVVRSELDFTEELGLKAELKTIPVKKLTSQGEVEEYNFKFTLNCQKKLKK